MVRYVLAVRGGVWSSIYLDVFFFCTPSRLAFFFSIPLPAAINSYVFLSGFFLFRYYFIYLFLGFSSFHLFCVYPHNFFLFPPQSWPLLLLYDNNITSSRRAYGNCPLFLFWTWFTIVYSVMIFLTISRCIEDSVLPQALTFTAFDQGLDCSSQLINIQFVLAQEFWIFYFTK